MKSNEEKAFSYYEIANMEYQLGDYKSALKNCNKAIKFEPKDCSNIVFMADIKIKLGDYKGANKDLNKAIKIDPNYAISYYCRAKAKKGLNDNEGSRLDRIKYFDLVKKYDDKIENN